MQYLRYSDLPTVILVGSCHLVSTSRLIHISPIQRSIFLSTPSLRNYSFPSIKWLEDVNQRYKCASTSPSNNRPGRNAGFKKNQETLSDSQFFSAFFSTDDSKPHTRPL